MAQPLQMSALLQQLVLGSEALGMHLCPIIVIEATVQHQIKNRREARAKLSLETLPLATCLHPWPERQGAARSAPCGDIQDLTGKDSPVHV